MPSPSPYLLASQPPLSSIAAAFSPSPSSFHPAAKPTSPLPPLFSFRLAPAPSPPFNAASTLACRFQPHHPAHTQPAGQQQQLSCYPASPQLATLPASAAPSPFACIRQAQPSSCSSLAGLPPYVGLPQPFPSHHQSRLNPPTPPLRPSQLHCSFRRRCQRMLPSPCGAPQPFTSSPATRSASQFAAAAAAFSPPPSLLSHLLRLPCFGHDSPISAFPCQPLPSQPPVLPDDSSTPLIVTPAAAYSSTRSSSLLPLPSRAQFRSPSLQSDRPA